MAKDLFHDVVKTALQKDGWTITDDPYEISAGNVDMLMDLEPKIFWQPRVRTTDRG